MESELLELREALKAVLLEAEKHKKLSRQVAEENAHTLAYLSAVVTHSPCAMVLEDDKGEIIFANQKFCDLFSITQSSNGLEGTFAAKWIESAQHTFKDGVGLMQRMQEIKELQVSNYSYETKLENQVYLREYIPVFDFSQRYIGHFWSYQESTSPIQEKTPSQDKAVLSSLPNKITFPPLPCAHVLLVEDNEVNRFLTTELLKSWGIRVDVANNGEEGLEKWKEKEYHLILMDIQMPVMDGLQAADAIRKSNDDLKSKIPLIALTANVSKGQKEEVLASGFDEYIAKPVNEAELYAKMASYLSLLAKKASPKKENTLYDYTILSKLSLGNKDFERKMIRIFIDTVPISIKKLQEAWATKNFPQLTVTAHKLKTTVHTMGIQPLKEPIKKLEAQAGTGAASEETQEQVESICNFLKAIVLEFEDVLAN